jgi:phosphoribosylglycinamide formyltransferase-1
VFKIIYLASGKGDVFKKTFLGLSQLKTTDYRLYLIADRECEALSFAKRKGISNEIISPSDYSDNEKFQSALYQAIRKNSPNLIICNYNRLLMGDIMNEYKLKIINLHYSLLPAFSGFQALDRAIEKGVKFCGATVHFVDESVDDGPIIAQALLPINSKTPKEQICEVLVDASAKMQLQIILWMEKNEIVCCDKIVSTPLKSHTFTGISLISPAISKDIENLNLQFNSELL